MLGNPGAGAEKCGSSAGGERDEPKTRSPRSDVKPSPSSHFKGKPAAFKDPFLRDITATNRCDRYSSDGMATAQTRTPAH